MTEHTHEPAMIVLKSGAAVIKATTGKVRISSPSAYGVARKKSAQPEALDFAMQIMEDRYFESILDANEPVRRICGTYKELEGEGTYSLTDESGVEHELKTWRDPQTASNSVSEQIAPAPQQRAQSSDGCAERPGNAALPVRDRLESLLEWGRNDADAASEFILSELRDQSVQNAWRNALIYAADAVEFCSPESREQLCSELLRTARAMRDSQAQDDRAVVLCAVHRAGSIIPESRVGEFEEFLKPKGVIDTRLAALQTIVRIFEAAPPDEATHTTGIVDRAATLAAKLWDVDVFASGEISALAIEGTMVVAVFADDRLESLLDGAVSLGKSWVSRKLQQRLNEIRGFRLSRDFNVSALDDALEKLKDGGHRHAGGSE